MCSVVFFCAVFTGEPVSVCVCTYVKKLKIGLLKLDERTLV